VRANPVANLSKMGRFLCCIVGIQGREACRLGSYFCRNDACFPAIVKSAYKICAHPLNREVLYDPKTETTGDAQSRAFLARERHEGYDIPNVG